VLLSLLLLLSTEYYRLSSCQKCKIQPESEFWILSSHRVEQLAICCVRDKSLWLWTRSSGRRRRIFEYTLCLEKNIPDIFSRNSRKHCRSFI